MDIKNKEGESPVECAALDTQLWLALRVNRKLREVSANRLMKSERILTQYVIRDVLEDPCCNGFRDAFSIELRFTINIVAQKQWTSRHCEHALLYTHSYLCYLVTRKIIV